MHWLLHQFWLTYKEIAHEITIPHTVTGMIGYAILHGLYAFIHREEVSLVRRLKNDHHKTAWLHVRKRHNGRFSRCKECVAIRAHRLPEPTQFDQAL